MPDAGNSTARHLPAPEHAAAHLEPSAVFPLGHRTDSPSATDRLVTTSAIVRRHHIRIEATSRDQPAKTNEIKNDHGQNRAHDNDGRGLYAYLSGVIWNGILRSGQVGITLTYTIESYLNALHLLHFAQTHPKIKQREFGRKYIEGSTPENGV